MSNLINSECLRRLIQFTRRSAYIFDGACLDRRSDWMMLHLFLGNVMLLLMNSYRFVLRLDRPRRRLQLLNNLFIGITRDNHRSFLYWFDIDLRFGTLFIFEVKFSHSASFLALSCFCHLPFGSASMALTSFLI